MRAIDADALCEYANNQKDKTIDANDIMRFPTIRLTNDLPPARDSHHDLIMRIVRAALCASERQHISVDPDGNVTVFPMTVQEEWISVKDRLPTSVANKVLVWLHHDDYVGYIGFGHYEVYKEQEIWFDLEHSKPFTIRGYTVTHWMSLPRPPKEEQ